MSADSTPHAVPASGFLPHDPQHWDLDPIRPEAGEGWALERYTATADPTARLDVVRTWGGRGTWADVCSLVTAQGLVAPTPDEARRLLARPFRANLVIAPEWRSPSEWLADHVHDLEASEVRAIVRQLAELVEETAGPGALERRFAAAMSTDGYRTSATLDPAALA